QHGRRVLGEAAHHRGGVIRQFSDPQHRRLQNGTEMVLIEGLRVNPGPHGALRPTNGDVGPNFGYPPALDLGGILDFSPRSLGPNPGSAACYPSLLSIRASNNWRHHESESP